jgi:hypothetical protein
MYRIPLFFLLLFSKNVVSAQIFFKSKDFQIAKKDLFMSGSCSVTSDRLRLTPAKANQSGSCWFNQKVGLKNGFETEFTFQINGNDTKENGGDGFAFVLQNQSTNTAASTGDGLGYQKIPNAVVIEFDTHKDADDKTRNQVALMEYDASKKEYTRKSTVHEIPELNDGKPHFARIEYRAGWLHFFLDSYIFPVLSSKIDISSILKAETAWIGFTASTSSAYSNHDILAWNINEAPDKPKDIDEKKVEVKTIKTIKVATRNLEFKVWDHNKIDGDMISIKINDKWLLSNYTLKKEPIKLEYTLTGFSANLVIYAHNLGTVPPNTATIEIWDGKEMHIEKLESNFETSQAITIQMK